MKCLPHSLFLLSAVLTIGGPAKIQAITLGELDDFSLTTESWQQGQVSPNLRVLTGGPVGAGDAYLQIESDATGSSLSRLVVFNRQAQWAGDYLSADVQTISMFVKNFGLSGLNLRLAFGTTSSPNTGDWFASTQSVDLAAETDWTQVEFPLGAADFTSVQGFGSFQDVMSRVTTMRILHSAAPGARGDKITATLGIDNILALGPAEILGDFNSDSMVDGNDLQQWEGDFAINDQSDADGDLDSDGNDFLIWQQNLGMGVASTSTIRAIPEPPTGLLVLTLLALLTSRQYFTAQAPTPSVGRQRDKKRSIRRLLNIWACYHPISWKSF